MHNSISLTINQELQNRKTIPFLYSRGLKSAYRLKIKKSMLLLWKRRQESVTIINIYLTLQQK